MVSLIYRCSMVATWAQMAFAGGTATADPPVTLVFVTVAVALLYTLGICARLVTLSVASPVKLAPTVYDQRCLGNIAFHSDADAIGVDPVTDGTCHVAPP